jgi:hypothetical protein
MIIIAYVDGSGGIACAGIVVCARTDDANRTEHF